MKKLVLTILGITMVMSLFSACEAKPSKETQAWIRNQQMQKQQQSAAASQPENGGSISGVVVETMNAGGYSYLNIDTGSGQVWAAVKEQPVTVGMTITVEGIMAMPDFRSETLDRTFDLIYFGSSVAPGGKAPGSMPLAEAIKQGKEHSKAPKADEFDFSGITVPSGGLRVGEIFEQKTDLKGKTVKLRGKVVKFVPQVMGKNWLHIQDGTGSQGTNDITVTTAATAAVGDIITVEGVLAVDKDFGYGYLYDLIIEEAKLSSE
ncbi:MAG: hypothetical protein GXO91_10145 [FCB group bacterium]|nr:hypothetical protein [FCB group bacterium]